MFRLKKIFALSLLSLIVSSFAGYSCNAFELPFFKKKYNPEEKAEESMVHTVDEWLETATSVNMDVREDMKDPFLKEDEKIIPPTDEAPFYIEAYNLKAGSKELDLTHLNKLKTVRSPFIADSDFNNAVYTETYLYPQTKQTASAIFLLKLDNNVSKKERLSDISIFEHQRNMLITTALPYFYDGFFSTLTVVDFSSDGKKILVKEKRGSNKYGLYETYVWVYYISKEDKYLHPAYMANLSRNEMKPAFDDMTSDFKNGFYTVGDEYSPDLGSLKNPPAGGLNSLNSGNSFNGRMDDGHLAKGEAGRPSDDLRDELRSGINVSQLNLYEFSAPKLNYKDVLGYVTANWKDAAMNSGLKSRWYNNVPDIYKANYDIGEKEKIGFGIRYNLLNDVIRSYWFDRKKLILNNIRWDLKPLGFNSADSDEVIVDAFAYLKDGKKASLGRWAVNVNDGIPRLTDEFEDITIEANAFWLVKRHNK